MTSLELLLALSVLTLGIVLTFEASILWVVWNLRKSGRRVSRFVDRLSSFLARKTDVELDALFARLDEFIATEMEIQARHRAAEK